MKLMIRQYRGLYHYLSRNYNVKWRRNIYKIVKQSHVSIIDKSYLVCSRRKNRICTLEQDMKMKKFTQITSVILLIVITTKNILLNELLIYYDQSICSTKLQSITLQELHKEIQRNGNTERTHNSNWTKLRISICTCINT